MTNALAHNQQAATQLVAGYHK